MGRVTANTKNCANCFWFRKEGGAPMRTCTTPNKIQVAVELVEVPGDEPTRISICSEWLDCGLFERGLLKSTI